MGITLREHVYIFQDYFLLVRKMANDNAKEHMGLTFSPVVKLTSEKLQKKNW